MATTIDKAELAQRINCLEGLDNETKSQLLELLHERKRYGLVWEDKPEAAEERLQNELPILREVKERAIISDDPAAPNHILIEGDNLEALTTLSYTHEGKIDVIYIDPPYNTGNKDFVYNDSYVDTEDQFRHSKWLSFMAKRLKIAKRLLADDGALFMSIDENELYALKVLADEIFGENNFIGQWNWYKSATPPALSLKLKRNVEYILGYEKHRSNIKYRGVQKKSSSNDPITKPQNTFKELTFPVGVLNVKLPDQILPKGVYGTLKFPNELLNDMVIRDGRNANPVTFKNRFIWLQTTLDEEIKKQTIFDVSKQLVISYKRAAYDPEVPPNFIDSSVGVDTNEEAGKQLAEIIGTGQFDYPKPVSLIRYILNFKPASTILDFFAGSGTTLHATMQLNAEDGGHRQCILVTNNENNICEEVTYERNKRVINGYTTPKGEQVEGLHANTLRYFKTDFVARESSATAKRELMYAATDMLCIKNNIYTEQPIFGSRKFRKDVCRYFQDGERSMLVIYNQDAIETIVEEIQKMQIETPILVYVFSLNDYAMDADFEDVSEKVSLCALPDAILRAYQRVLPKKQRKEAAL